MLSYGQAYICPIDSDGNDAKLFMFREFHIDENRYDCIFQTVGEIADDLNNHFDMLLSFGDEYLRFNISHLQVAHQSWESESVAMPNGSTDGIVSVDFTNKYVVNFMDITRYSKYGHLPTKMRTNLERIKLLET